MKGAFAYVSIALVSCAAQVPTDKQAIIDRIEREVTLPKGSGPLRCYERYYTAFDSQEAKRTLGFPSPTGGQVIVGNYVIGKHPGVHWKPNFKDMPMLNRYDSGCSLISTYYFVGLKGLRIEANCASTWDGNQPRVVNPPVTC